MGDVDMWNVDAIVNNRLKISGVDNWGLQYIILGQKEEDNEELGVECGQWCANSPIFHL